jgi:pyruvate dehydrogenase E1 component alpha subunit
VVSSAIVGGVIPIALGIALGIKRGERGGLVHCFVGDMTAMTGAYAEAVRYSSGQDLPVSWVVEDNGKSVLTNTYEAWGMVRTLRMEHRCYYDMRFPHAGAGRRVEF